MSLSRSLSRRSRFVPIAAAVALLVAMTGAAQASKPEDVARLQKTRSCANCDLSGADLSGYSLAKADLSRADLSGAKLYKVDLSNANLSGANFVNSDLTGANLTGATGADLTAATTTAKTKCPSGLPGPCK